MDACNAYESESMCQMLGDTLRPGGFRLTEQGIRFCRLSVDDRVLDMGCGRGATVHYLQQTHHIHAVGVDPSDKLIGEAKRRYGDADFFSGKGEALPFEDGSFHCVLAECTLSLMDADRAIREASRVLKEKGWFIITDVYARNPDAIGGLAGFSVNSCMRGLHHLPQLIKKLQRAGFEIAFLEDCTLLLKELLVQIIFSCGSMSAFWNASSGHCIDGGCFHDAMKQCRPGYFILVGRKVGVAHG